MHHHRLAANHTGEYELFARNATSNSALTYFWMTCGGSDGSQCFNLYQTTFRFYVDGELTASLELPYGLAHGVGGTYMGPQMNESDHGCTRGDCAASWGAGARFGKASHTGALFDTYRMPFGKSVRITMEAPPAGTCAACRNAQSAWSLYVVLRGIEGIDSVRVGDLALPAHARLRSHRHHGSVAPMAFVPLLDVPRGRAGAVLLTSLAVASGTENFLEGCVRAHIDGADDVTLLSSGTEDYFSSAFYFNAGTYALAEAGLTHLNDSRRDDDPRRWTLSAYKVHEQDVLAFRDGLRFSWRNGDTASHVTGLKCCGDEVTPFPVGCYKLWDPRQSDVDALVLAYDYEVAAQPTTQPTADAVAPPVPRLTGWVNVTGMPDLGPQLNSPSMQPVDFSVWQAADGSWQMWSCIRSTKVGGHSRLFYRWEAPSLHGSWRRVGVAMEADSSVGEEPGGLQAPHVTRWGNTFHMFYGTWDAIAQAVSTDGKVFTRVLDTRGQVPIFMQGNGTWPPNVPSMPAGYANTRDPMLFATPAGDGVTNLHLVYSAHPPLAGLPHAGGVWARTLSAKATNISARLQDWGAWAETRGAMIGFGGQAGTGPYSSECPHVVFDEASGYYYLLRTQRYTPGGGQTSVYASRDPSSFGVGSVSDAYFVTRLPVAAPEVIRDADGKLWLFALKEGLDGMRMAQLTFEAPGEL